MISPARLPTISDLLAMQMLWTWYFNGTFSYFPVYIDIYACFWMIKLEEKFHIIIVPLLAPETKIFEFIDVYNDKIDSFGCAFCLLTIF
jgi:hypothetical protein